MKLNIKYTFISYERRTLMNIIKAIKEDAESVTSLALMLWPDHSFQELYDDFYKMFDDDNCALFLVRQNDTYIGFAQCQLRFDYVEGTDTSPVGYLEGIYILNDYRHMGVGRKLVTECERWSKTKGCSEFASDVEMGNLDSYHFHIKLGFREENRVICFAKKI